MSIKRLIGFIIVATIIVALIGTGILNNVQQYGLHDTLIGIFGAIILIVLLAIGFYLSTGD